MSLISVYIDVLVKFLCNTIFSDIFFPKWKSKSEFLSMLILFLKTDFFSFYQKI